MLSAKPPFNKPLIIISQCGYNFKGKLGMAKPKNNEERNLFTEIDLQIMLINEKIKNHRRSIEKAKKEGGWNGPASAGGIDYSKERTPSVHISFLESLRFIEHDEQRIKELQEERKELRRSKKRIEKIFASLTGYEYQVYNYRVIQKMTQQEAAEKMSISTRQFQRIESDMKDKGLI